MHLLEIDKENYIGQADPFIFESNGNFISTPLVMTEFTLMRLMTFSANGTFTAEFSHMTETMFMISGRLV